MLLNSIKLQLPQKEAQQKYVCKDNPTFPGSVFAMHASSVRGRIFQTQCL